jgi:hypothetical protein
LPAPPRTITTPATVPANAPSTAVCATRKATNQLRIPNSSQLWKAYTPTAARYARFRRTERSNPTSRSALAPGGSRPNPRTTIGTRRAPTLVAATAVRHPTAVAAADARRKERPAEVEYVPT